MKKKGMVSLALEFAIATGLLMITGATPNAVFALNLGSGIDGSRGLLKEATSREVPLIPAAVSKSVTEEQQRAWMEKHLDFSGKPCDGWNNGRSYSARHYPRTCKVVEYPIRDGQGWIDTKPNIAYSEYVRESSVKVYPTLDGRLWVCDSGGGASCLFGPPDVYERFENIPAAAKKMFHGEGFDDNITLLGRYSWPVVKDILTGRKKDCTRTAARLAKHEDVALHPEEWVGDDVYSGSTANTAYGRNGYREKTQIRFEGPNSIHEIQVIHNRGGIRKLDDYKIALDAKTCRKVSIEAGSWVVSGYGSGRRGGATLADFLNARNVADSIGRIETIDLPAASGAGLRAWSSQSTPVAVLVKLFDRNLVKDALTEADKLEVPRTTNPDGYRELMRARPHLSTLHQALSRMCSVLQDTRNRETVIEAEKDDSAPNIDVTLAGNCMQNMLEIYPE